MTSIKILRAPQGTEPAKLRAEWVGVVIPLATEEDLASKPIRDPTINQRVDHVVLRAKAIHALRDARKLDAADSLERSPTVIYLGFKKSTCEVIE